MDTIRDQRGFKFGKIVEQVLFHKGISNTAKVLYAALDKYADNETARAFPGLLRLAENLGMGTSSAHRGIQELVGIKAVAVEKKSSKKGWRNIYTFLDVKSIKG